MTSALSTEPSFHARDSATSRNKATETNEPPLRTKMGTNKGRRQRNEREQQTQRVSWGGSSGAMIFNRLSTTLTLPATTLPLSGRPSRPTKSQ